MSHSLHSDDASSKASAIEMESTNKSASASSQRSGSTEEDLTTIKDQLTAQETKAVFRLRVLVILILVAAAAAVSVTVFFLTRNSEKDEFRIQYEGVAGKVIQSFEDSMVEIAAVSGLGVAASAHSVDHNSDWPFVTLSNFQQRAGNARTLSGTLYVSINPIVQSGQLEQWENYTLSDNNDWLEEGLAFQEELGLNGFADEGHVQHSRISDDIVDPVHIHDENGDPARTSSEGPYLPRWQTSPVLQSSMVNENLFEDDQMAQASKLCVGTEAAVLGGFVTAPPGPISHENTTTAFFATLRSMWEGEEVEYLGDPMAHLAIPVFDTFHANTRKVVAVMISTIHWGAYFTNILPSNVDGITVVVENECDGAFTYEIHGDEAHVVGFGDRHNPNFSGYKREGRITATRIDDGTVPGIDLNQDGCPYSVHVYPTQKYYDSFITKDPVAISIAIAFVFFFTIAMFLFYDRLVERRQKLVLAKATQSTAIVASLFPKQVRDRLMAAENDRAKGNALIAPNHRLKTFLNGNKVEEKEGSQPIADLFPNCTVFFADISGFTAWSSTREPSQVFVLLQAVYQAFDVLAKKRHVFKVETIGDSYVAVTGLPEPQPNHAIIMAKFASECLYRVQEITRRLEVQLGPDTGDLDMRFGLHSGPVTAGVLRGDRARFQLFGDTVNTASRMESTGSEGKIQVSQSTADVLTRAGKENWLTAREDVVKAKGKGVLKTYWLQVRGFKDSSELLCDVDQARVSSTDVIPAASIEKQERMVDWMVDLLLEHVKKIVCVREGYAKDRRACSEEPLYYDGVEGQICLDEVKEAIEMPEFDAKTARIVEDASTVAVPLEQVSKLREYVALIAKSYCSNPFHNFEHACHVTMSVNKLLKRIVAPDLTPEEVASMAGGIDKVAAQMHDCTHGITSDPMAAFAMVFSALIHDVDHQGISNTQLIKEEPETGAQYRNKSVAEQNSLDVAWDVLMFDQFRSLREYVFGTKVEMMRFRQLIVNTVLATDIFDKEFNDLRKHRWEHAFSDNVSCNLKDDHIRNLRATIVMEHIIQASDVSHTMQHWHVYQKWNRMLFTELYKAYKAGRMETNPANFWYNGELGFLDNYVIPLAKKLKDCNVFGVSSDEYLNYAVMNRAEWAERGHDVVTEFVEELETENPSDATISTVPGSTASVCTSDDNGGVI